MRKHLIPILGIAILATAAPAAAQQPQQKSPTLRSILLEQFDNTWNKQDWYVPVKQALEGLTAQQAMWKPCDSCHSVGELAYHIYFWNRASLDSFYNRKQLPFSGNNNETFTTFTEASWTTTVQQLNQVMADWEKAIATADEAKLRKWYSTLDHINTHTAYHTGQILYIRKLAGNWDSNKGVK
ncbi:DinB family protein [Puia dinghuensis]|uniref:DinB-like domain-containing protein n=1 Tax=Puia dinghuensis TaxID=1792502 RepID=A0A8J2UE97_9BACT|nr:DinB family protein [Puia dinghuensis]GGB03791.1 hypothetical protein GCM10011511_28890 [Puia dinghuensis]